MKNRLHTILILVAAATAGVLWTGCDDRYVPEPDQPDGRAIGFSCGAVKSRAQETDINNISSFRVSAVWNKSGSEYIDKYMDGRLVEKKGSDGWVYSPVSYMPAYGTLDFFAYSPADASVSEFKSAGIAFDQISIAYDVTTDHAAQHDFMVAEALEVSSPSVFLDFKHVLSSVRVKAKCTVPGLTARVYKVELINLCRQGVLKGTTSSAPGKTTVWTWDNQTAPATYVVAQNGPVDVTDAFMDISAAEAGPLMILPQTVNNGSNVLVGTGDIGTGDGKFPSWMLGMPKDIATNFYVAVDYDLLDSHGPTTERSLTNYFPLFDPDDMSLPFTFAMGGKYVFRIDIK